MVQIKNVNTSWVFIYIKALEVAFMAILGKKSSKVLKVRVGDPKVLNPEFFCDI